MVGTAVLLERLAEIGRSLAATDHGLALLGLGSVGTETDRLDEFSDLDFFAIVERGHQGDYLADLGWLTRIAPVAFAFRNSPDGFKLLYDDGVLCEFAVLEAWQLPGIPFTPGRVVWRRDDVDPASLRPAAVRADAPVDVAWQVGEAMTNLLVGLGRYHRGERLAAARMVQGHAVDRVLAIASTLEPGSAGHRDPFAAERRAETLLPGAAPHLPDFLQGYDRTPESARAIVAYLDARVPLDPALRAAVLQLCERR